MLTRTDPCNPISCWTRSAGRDAPMRRQKKGALLSESALLARGEEGKLLLLRRATLRRGIVLLLVDVLRRSVLVLVDVLLLARGQLPAIGFAIRGHLLVDALLLIL